MEIQWTINDDTIKEIYWSRNLSLDEVMEKGKECDVLRIWYPQNLDDRIYERYGDILAYIELEGKWKGKAYSSVIDLSQNEAEIMSLFSKTRRYEIRRAMERDLLHAIYQFVTYGFTLGAKVTKAMQIPCVKDIFALARYVRNEAHWFVEFLRFRQVSIEPSVLLAVIEPEAQVLAMLTPHFADRLNPERFVIYDKRHGEAAFHMPGEQWFIRILSEGEKERLENMWEQREEYVDLWKTFFESVCIEERRNKDLQRNMLRMRFRKNMTEFQ